MITAAQQETVAEWLIHKEGVTPGQDEIIGTIKTFDHYVLAWGDPQERQSLADGTPLWIWRGEGFTFWVADFGEARAAAVF